MGKNASRIARCEAVSDPTIVPPPPPTPGQGAGMMGQPAPPPQEQPYVSEKFRCNPGTYEELHRKCKEMFPMPFEGAKVIINKSLNQGFQVSHSLSMSSFTPSGYRFGATYIGSRLVTPQDPGLLLMSDMDPSGNLNAQGVYNYSEGWKMKFAAQILENKFASTQISSDIRGKDWTATATFANPNLFKNTGIGVFQFLQALTPRVCVGAELMYQQAPQIPGGAATVLSLCGRYTGDESVWSGYAGTATLGLCYYRRLNEEIQVGVEVENNYQQQVTNVSLGYQFELPKANFTMKAMVDNNWTVTGVFEKRLHPMPFQLSLCGALNHVKNQFRLGCGFTVGV